MPADSRVIVLRIVVYICASLSLYFVLMADASIAGSKFFENSLTENLQELVFLLMVAAYAFHAWKAPETSVLSLMLAGFFLLAFVRELDEVIESNLGTGVWQIIVSVILLGMIYRAWKDWQALLRQISQYMATYPFGLFVAGFLVTFAYSRVAGNEEIWIALMGEDAYQRNVKNAVEESTELLGDLLLLISCVEYFFRFRIQVARGDK